jgi:ferredoxin-NADP reductase
MLQLNSAPLRKGHPAWQRLVDPHWVDFVLEHVSPTVRIARTLAVVEGVRSETPDIKTFLVRPNRRFRGFQPGQFVPVRVVIDGVVNERYYSFTSLPATKTVSFTVKRIPGGRVSNWLHDNVFTGSTLELGEPGGEYLLPAEPAPLLLIAGGSGITPNFSLVQAALNRRPGADVVLFYYARSEADFAFQRELLRLAQAHPGFRLHFFPETGPHAQPRFTRQQLDALVPDFAQRRAYVCGPAGLMEAVHSVWQEAGLAANLRREVFAAPTPAAKSSVKAAVTFRRSQRTVQSNKPSLLETAESAGLRPASGCRMGICNTCVCTKVSGTTRDRVTGAIDHTPNSRIKICVSEPVGPVTLDL